MSMPHRIRRLRWNARASSVGDAFALRQLLRERGDAVQAALERALQSAADNAALGDEVLHLGRLELRLGAASLAELAQDFEGGVERAARESVRSALREARQRPRGDGVRPAAGERRRADAERRACLQHYLVHGLHDWTLAGLAPEDAVQLLRQAALSAAEARGGIVALLAPGAPVRERVGALLRWLRLLTPAQRLAWVAREARTDALAPVAAALAALRALLDADTPDTGLLQALWLAWPDAADAAAQRTWHRELAAWLPTLPAALPPQLRDLLAALNAPSALGPPPAAPAGPGAPMQVPQAADAPLLAPLAGLVLLHPYLPRLLAGCGIVEERAREFPPAALPRACGLLHWLATGQDEAAEFDLPLVKLLLGAPPDRPLDLPPAAAGAPDRDEALALLATIPQHWRALRGTGVDGLRLSFLQRRGLLARSDGGGGWRLRVQGEPFDLLLASLPWSLGLVRLPWMTQVLQVEWEAP